MKSIDETALALILARLTGGPEAVRKIVEGFRPHVEAELEEGLLGPARAYRSEHPDGIAWVFGEKAKRFVHSVSTRTGASVGVICSLTQRVLEQEDRARDMEATVLRLDIELSEAQGRLADAEIELESYRREERERSEEAGR